MNFSGGTIRELKGKALGNCSFCSSFAACTLYVRSDGRELLVCGDDDCQKRVATYNGSVAESRERSLSEARRAQGRAVGVSTEL